MDRVAERLRAVPGATGWHRTFDRRMILLGWSIGGYLFGALSLAVYRPGGWIVAPDLAAYLRAGRDFLDGNPVYVSGVAHPGAFNYGPPWVLVAALLTWLPPLLVQTLISLGSLAALRYVVGSWRAVGWTLWWPITTISLISGNIDLLIAAAMVMAWRGRPGWLALFGLAKVAPFLGLPLGSWRRCAVIVGAAVLATAPWWHLWPEWLAYLIGQPGVPTYALLVPWWLRLPVALALVALRRPWASAAAVVVAMPYLYGFTTMEGLAVIRLWADGRRRA